jgi:FkbM family methyltransferase
MIIIPRNFNVNNLHSFQKIYGEGLYDEIPISKSDVVVDVGANIGILSKYMLPKAGRIIGIEPCPENIKFLKANCPPAEIYECGVLDREGYFDFNHYSIAIGMSNFGDWDVRSDYEIPETRKVRVSTLDCLLVSEHRVNFLNMDVEGSEMRALQGARETIVKHRPTMMIALDHRAQDREVIPAFILSIVPEYEVRVLGSGNTLAALFSVRGGGK